MLYWRGLPGPPLQVDSDGTGVLLVNSTQYVNNMACSWTFTPAPGRYAKVTFVSFNVSAIGSLSTGSRLLICNQDSELFGSVDLHVLCGMLARGARRS